MFTPWARIICWLKPVARIAAPISVPKNQYIKKPTTRTTASPTASVVYVWFRPVRSCIFAKIVGTPKRDWLALPMMRRLTE